MSEGLAGCISYPNACRGDFPLKNYAIMAHMEEQAVDYVVLEVLDCANGRYLAPAVNEHMDRFSIAWKDNVPRMLKLDN